MDDEPRDDDGWPDGMLAGALLRDARRRSGMTREALAEVAGVAPGTLASWEDGDAQPTVAMLARVLRAAGMELLPRLEPLGRHDIDAVRDLALARVRG